MRDGGARVTPVRSAVCAHCRQRFPIQRRPGPPPQYCSPAHRQRAYEARQATARADLRDAEFEELAALRRRVNLLERDNLLLRRELEDANAELSELRPVSPAIARLVGREAPTPPPPARSRRRRR